MSYCLLFQLLIVRLENGEHGQHVLKHVGKTQFKNDGEKSHGGQNMEAWIARLVKKKDSVNWACVQIQLR